MKKLTELVLYPNRQVPFFMQTWYRPCITSLSTIMEAAALLWLEASSWKSKTTICNRVSSHYSHHAGGFTRCGVYHRFAWSKPSAARSSHLLRVAQTSRPRLRSHVILQSCSATVPITSLWLVIQASTPGPLDISVAAFTALIPFSQQIHYWTHSQPSMVPVQIAWLQDRGVLISSRAHQAHHKEPHNARFAIVSGWWDPLLDARNGWFWRTLAGLILAITGAYPRCWQAPRDNVIPPW